ncbi:MAG TPA: MATE family efflux transporter, partial [Polyangiaceae bacterium]|nr:MATE family efflux transporter [Polyangiaceae bacterium]
YSLPAVAGFLASALYQLVDRILVGRGVGTEAMAAVTCAYPLTMLALGVGLLLGTGTGNQISTLLGQGNRDEAERVLGQSLRLAAQLGGGLALALIVFARPLLRLCSAEGAVLEQAVPFLRIVAVGQVFLVAMVGMGNIVRVQGRPGLSLAFMASGNILNALLAAFAIFGLGLGVIGAALATTLSVILNFVALVAFVQSPASHLHIRSRHLKADPALARSILGLGAPMLFMQLLGSVVFLAANHGAAASSGPRGVAAVGVFNTVSMLLIYPPLGVAQAMQPLVAFNRGAQKPERVRALLGRTLATTSLMGAASAALVCVFPAVVAAWFTRTDTTLVALVREGLPWCMASVALFSVPATASHYYLAVQQARSAGLLLLGRQLLLIPLFLLLPLALGFSGLYFAPVLADLPFAVFGALLMQREWRTLGAAERLAVA